ncbi:MAG: hypothetical protein GX295_11850 [Syntrophomonadaceae bacterium]|nr:hypothetical protein [Syntrophomonadaceae bacterium]
MTFRKWLKVEGYYTYNKAYDIFVSRGYDSDKLFDEYCELEDEYANWCESNDINADYEW